MDIELIASIAGIAFSLAISYFPKFDVWFAAQDNGKKAGVVLGFTTLAVALIWGSGCLGLWGACVMDWREIVRAWIMAAFASQATYLITPQTNRVQTAKLDGWLLRNGESDQEEPE